MNLIAVCSVSLILVCCAFVIGVQIGRHIESKWWLRNCSDNWVEKEHMRSENEYLKNKLRAAGEPPVRVGYICDRKFCEECDNPECHHTLDINHAKNFELIADNEYWEKEQ